MESEAPFWPLSARRVAQLTGGELLGSPEVLGERVVTDSRSGIRPGDLFIGLVGPHFDGGRFAAQALAEGAAIALLRSPAESSEAPQPGAGQAVILVADPLAALQALAIEARRRFTGTVLAITGSNGKTLIKDMLVAALGEERRVSASPQSYNSQVGVALSLLQLDPAAEVAILECGISQSGEMERQEQMVRPLCGIFTNVGDAHVAGLGSREVTAREKAQLFRRLPPDGAPAWVLVPAAEELARAALRDAGAPLRLLGPEGAFDVELRGEQAFLISRDEALSLPPVELPVGPVPPFQRTNAALAAAAALLLGASPEAITAGLARWHPAPMRLELSTTPRGVLLINDAYTADPVSVEAALETLVREGGGATFAVLGGMAQLGKGRLLAHQRVGRRVVELGVDHLIGVGDGGGEITAAAVAAGFPPERAHTVAGVTEAAMVLEEHCRPGDRVLLKASRPERLERIAALLFDSVSPTRLYVDLDALVDNYRRLRGSLPPGCGVMAVVKSFGYGLDAVRVARALERAGVEYLAVAYPDEGVRLRDRGITTPILVQNVLPQEVDKVTRYGLTAEVFAAEQVDFLAREAAAQRRVVRVHLKVDTGMGRMGTFLPQLPDLARQVAESEWLSLEGLMTHFAASEDPARDEFTRRQIERFALARQMLRELGIEPRWVHAANSAAAVRFPEARGTMVRTGLGLLGYGPLPEAPVGLPKGQPEGASRPILELTTRVISVKQLPPGHFVGYGLTFETGESRRIAVVAIGYGDGYPWALSNRGWMRLHDHPCPVVGRVCMDVTMLDVTDLGDRVQPGDEVTVFGPEEGDPPLALLAELAATIPYELLTRISPRVRRIFRTSH